MILIDFNLGYLAEKTLEEFQRNTQLMPSCSNGLCVYQHLGECLALGGQLDLSDIDRLPSNMSETAVTGAFVKHNFCYVTNKGKPSFEDKAICEAALTRIGKMVDMNTSIDYASENMKRIVVKENKIMSLDENEITGPVLCKSSTAMRSVEHLLMLIKTGLIPIWNKLVSLFNIFRSNYIKNMIKEVEECGNSKINFTSMSKQHAECIAEMLKVRVKRSSLLSYLLGDGRQLDELSSTLISITKKINKNTNKFLTNEKSLVLNQQITSANIEKLSRAAKFSNLEKLALMHKLTEELHSVQATSYNNAIVVSNLVELEHIEQILNKFFEIIPKIMLHENSTTCTSIGAITGCINNSESLVFLSNKGHLKLSLSMQALQSEETNLLSCIPNLTKMQISQLHGRHGIKDKSTIILDDYVIEIVDLKKEKVVNSEKRKITNDELINGNIFITKAGNNIGVSCVKPELLFQGNTKINCTTSVTFVPRDLPVISSTGIVAEHINLKPKIYFGLDFVTSPADRTFLNDEENKTSTVPLNELVWNGITALEPPQLIGFTVGISTVLLVALLVLCCFCYCCCNKVCNQYCCRSGPQQAVVEVRTHQQPQSIEDPAPKQEARKLTILKNLFSKVNPETESSQTKSEESTV